MKPWNFIYFIHAFFVELLDLNKETAELEIQEEVASPENSRFQTIFIFLLLYILLIITGAFG
jgi:hypothetical protein